MSVSEPTLPGAFPATPANASNEPDPFVEAAKSYALDLSEKTKPYLPEAVARHLPEKSEHEINDGANPSEFRKQVKFGSLEYISQKGHTMKIVNGKDAIFTCHSRGITGKQSNQGGKLPFSKDDRGQQLEEKERTRGALDVASAKSIEDRDDDENDKVIPVDPNAEGLPKGDVDGEQEHEKEETSPSIFISNCHPSGNETRCCPAHNGVEPEASGSSARALPVSEGVAEDQLLADYLGPREPTENEGNVEETYTPNGLTTPGQFEPRVRDFAVEEEIARMSINTGESDTLVEGEPTVLIDSINEPYKPHRLENIQEKTRDNRLPPLGPSPSTSTPSSPDVSYKTGSGSVLAKLIRGRRSSSAASKDDPCELRRSTSAPSHEDSEQDIDRKLEEIHEGSVDSPEQTDPGDPPQSQKVGLMTKVKGEIKVAIGVLQRNKEKVEEGKRMIENR